MESKTRTQIQDVNQALERAKEEGEIFLVSLNKEELERAGFDTSVFGPFEFVNVYLQWDREFVIKYQFDGDNREVYYEKMRDIGGEQNFIEVIESYLRIAQHNVTKIGDNA